MKKKFIWRSIALTLVFALLIQVMPVGALSINNTVNMSSGNEAESTIIEENVNVFSYTDVLEANDENIICEVPELREETVKHFRLTDGSMVAAVYDLPVHEQASDGTWVDIDNTITSGEDDEGSSALTKGNAISFANKAKDGKLLTIKTDYGKIKWSIDGISGKVKAAAYVAPEVEANNTKMAVKSASGIITYEDVMTDVDLKYQLVGNDVKENIILNSSAAAQSFSFTLDIGNKMTAVLEDNCVVIYSSAGEVVRTISAPYMMDANDIISDNVTLSLTENKKNYTVTVTPDMEWLLDESRAYPVIIDPTITKKYTNSTVDNTSVNSNRPTSSAMYQYGVLYVGRESSSYNNLRGVFKFTLPTGITESDMIIDAYVKLTQRNYFGSGSVTVNAHQITSSLALSSLTWNKLNGKYSSTVLDSQVASSSTKESHFIWDITAAVKSWYLNGNNYGLALVSENEGGTYKYATFYTSRYPDITTAKLPAATITYLNHDGLEDYLTYHEAGSSTMGSIAVGDFNGNLIYAYTDLSMTGNYMPVTIQHVYNHSKRSTSSLVSSNMLYGLGMRLNLSQKIETSTVTGYPYKYTDADGTVHYFALKSGTSGANGSVYEKEFETTTTITKTSTGYTLSDGSTVSYYFNTSGLLTSITDASNNKTMTLSYTDNRLTSVTDGAGRVTTLAYTDNYLTSITDPSGRSTTYAYENECLSQITKPDGTTVKLTYTYTNSTYMLTGIEDIDGSKITVSYYTYAPHRIASLTEYGTQGTEGNKLTWTYTAGETTVTDRNGKSETMMFDNFGHTICIRDGEGNAVYGSYSNTEDNNKNSLLYQSNMQHTVTNYLKNHHFNSDVNSWSAYGSDSGTIGYTQSDAYEGGSAYFVNDSADSHYGMYQDVTIPSVASNALTLSAHLTIDTDLSTTTPSCAYMGIQYQLTEGIWTGDLQPINIAADNWQRYSVTAETPENALGNKVRVIIMLDKECGGVLVDNVQLEPGVVANRYNMIENGHFAEATGATTVSGWTNKRTNTSTDKTVAGRDGSGFYIKGVPANSIYLYQDIKVSGNEGDSFVVGGWAKGNPVAFKSRSPERDRYFGIRILFYKEDGTYDEPTNLLFEAKTPNWQYISGSVSAPYDYEYISVLLWYRYQSNSCTFDDIQMHREPFGTRMEYDDDGRMTSSIDSMGRETKYEYVAEKRPEISKITYADGTTTTYNYDTTTWRLLSVTDANGNVTTYNYDENGNPTGSSMATDGLTLNSATTEYSGSYVLSATDVLGNTTNYNYNENRGLLNSVTDASGVITSYTYNDSNDDLTNVSSAGSEVDYTYSYGKLSSISHNTDSNSENDVTYNFVYDEFGNTSSVKVGSQALMSYTYEPNNGLLTQSTYGNGDTYTPTYDSLDRITAVSYNGVEKYNWVYGADGRIGLHNDLVNDVTWRYEYAKDGALTSAYGTNGERFDYTYEPSTGKLLTATVSDGTTSKITTYNYSDHTNGEDANLIESIVLPTATVTYDYDSFYRASYDVEVSGSDILTTDYTFVDGIAENSTTILVDSMITTGNGWSETLSYTYDCKGNIETISENGTQKVKYYYDDLNQLVREDNAWLGKTIAYTYDNGGNIQLVEEYALTSGALDGLTATNSYTYLYGDSNWKDKLTSFNGNAIIYDEIGNPISYYNGLNFDWQNGRQLANVSGNELNISYTYDANGIRTSKTVNGITTTYTLEGSNIVKETNGTDTLWFYYDAVGVLTGFELNGTPYFYVKNIQGDIIGITDANGNIVVEYLYGSWGKLLSTTGSHASTVGTKNPFRYRGYYYDTEIELYYLQSRYYDAATKKLINVDSQLNIFVSQLGTNLFAYCDNNPINRADTCGNAWETVFDVISLVVSFVDACRNPSDGSAWVGVVCDAADLIPFATGIGEAYRAYRTGKKVSNTLEAVSAGKKTSKIVDTVSDSMASAKKGWKVGDDITNLTKAGNTPKWSTIRARYWKNKVHFNPGEYEEYAGRMKKGLAPLVKYSENGKYYPMELHHPHGQEGANIFIFEEVSPWEHDSRDKFRHFRG